MGFFGDDQDLARGFLLRSICCSLLPFSSRLLLELGKRVSMTPNEDRFVCFDPKL